MTAFDHVYWGLGAPYDPTPGLWVGMSGEAAPPLPPQQGDICTDPLGNPYTLCDGVSSGCISDVYQVSPNVDPNYSLIRTGMSSNKVYMPRCPNGQAQGQRGDAFVALNSNQTDGGIGILLRTGTSPQGNSYSFLQTVSNVPGVQGMYVNFRAVHLDDDDRFYPFVGAENCANGACQRRYKMKIQTRQRYKQFLDNGYSGAFQILRVTLRNSNGTPGVLSDDETLSVGIRTFCNHDSIQNVSCPNRVDLDPNQGTGVHYFEGQLESSGTESTWTRNFPTYGTVSASLWESLGNPTQSSPFNGAKTFRATVSWWQFVSMLRGVAYQAGYNGGTYGGVANVFGSHWNQPDYWFVEDVRFGQELKNENWDGSENSSWSTRLAESGGSLYWFNLTPQVDP